MKNLLLHLCHYPFDEKDREHLSDLLGEVQDWPALVNLINSHGIIALAAYNIKEAGLENIIPGDSMALLENGLLKTITRNAWLTERWKEVNTILENAGIKHILLKGMALEHTVYGSAGLRQMNDNDIYIKPEDSAKAWYLLQDNGFVQEPFKSPLFKKMMFSLGRHLPALYNDGYTLEIHDTLFENEASGEKSTFDLLNDAEEITIGETKALILSKEIQLKHLISHFEHHKNGGECQLRLYNDILMLNKNNLINLPDRFIEDPIQSSKPEFRKAAYNRNIKTIPAQYRFRFIIGDTFPTLTWMRKRYKCGVVSALVRYPARILKVLWMI